MRGPAHGAAAPGATTGRRRLGSALWLAPPVCLAGLAYVAVSWLPPTYRASLLLTGPTDFARSACVDSLAARDGRDAGLGLNLRGLVVWLEGGNSLATLGMRETGVRTVGDRSVELWVQDGEAEVSRRLVSELAGSVTQCVATSSVAGSSQAAVPVAQSPSPVPPERGAGALTLLRAQLDEARAQRDAARSRLAALAPAQASAGTEDDDPAAVTARARALEDRTRSLQRAIADLEAGRAANVAEADIAAGDGWTRYAAASARRDDLQAGIRTMAETLLDGHPRMTIARLRLAELQAEVQTASRDLLGDLRAELARQRAALGAVRQRETVLAADRERAAAQEAEHAALQRDRDVADALVRRLEAAVGDAERQDTPDTAPAETAAGGPSPAAQPGPAPTLVPPQAGDVLTETLAPPVWPAVIGAGSVGLALSLFGLATAGRRRQSGGLSPRLRERRARGADETGTLKDADTGGDAQEIATIDEVIEALMTSGISRALLVQAAPAPRPLGVDVIRRLALRGQLAAIVDLSDDQATARAMGAGPDAPGMSDLVEGEATFATIARRDFATRADIIPGGRRPANARLDTLAERRNVLDFIERSYEILLIDCGRMAPSGVRDLMDNDAALLLATQGGTAKTVQGAVEALREAGLDDVILVGESG